MKSALARNLMEVPRINSESARLPEMPAPVSGYPELRYMGSKRRLLPWIFDTLNNLDFESALDPFSGSGCVAYLMKAMGRRVVAGDFLNFPTVIAKALIENNRRQLDGKTIKSLLASVARDDFVQRTFGGVFYTAEDLSFLDRVTSGIMAIPDQYQQALASSALFRSCLKRQPRGVFTISGDLSRYDDGRRDLQLSLEEHFIEQVEAFNQAVLDNGRRNLAVRADVFEAQAGRVDLVYLDPPYVPRADDNCYIKRYHFLEGLSCYWTDLPVDLSTKVRKIPKRFTPFSYRKTAAAAFERMFERFKRSTIVLSYSSNGYPDLPQLESMLRKVKRDVRVFERPHRYHFGTHGNVARATTTEYLLVGR